MEKVFLLIENDLKRFSISYYHFLVFLLLLPTLNTKIYEIFSDNENDHIYTSLLLIFLIGHLVPLIVLVVKQKIVTFCFLEFIENNGNYLPAPYFSCSRTQR